MQSALYATTRLLTAATLTVLLGVVSGVLDEADRSLVQLGQILQVGILATFGEWVDTLVTVVVVSQENVRA